MRGEERGGERAEERRGEYDTREIRRGEENL